MKRHKTVKINKSYDDTIKPTIPKEERDEMMRRFLEAGGKVYKSRRGRRKGELTKAQITEHNEKVLEKQKKELDEKVNRTVDETSK